MSDAQDWRQMLRAARKALGLDLPTLAQQLGMSPETLRAYESGRRRPTRTRLTTILDHMKLGQIDRNRILVSAGFAADGASLGLDSGKRQMSFEQAAAEVRAATWPAWVVGDMVEIIAANDLAVVRAAVATVVGAENVIQPEPTMGGEDFAYFLQERPGCFFFVGSRNEARGLTYGHHHPRFDVDEAALPIGVEALAAVALAYLNS